MNDIDIIVGVKDLATSVLDRLSSKVNSIGDSSKLAFAGAAERLSDQLAKASSNFGGGGIGNGDKLAKAIDAAAIGMSTKLDAALAKTNSAIDGMVAKVHGAIGSVTRFVTKAAAIATIGSAFITVGRGIHSATGALANLALGHNKAEVAATNHKVSVLGSLAPYARYVVAAGATATLAQATLRATSATTGLVGKVTALGRGALAAFVLTNALKKTENGASTLSAKLAKVAGFALAFDVVTRATIRFVLSLIGIKKNADDSTTALIKTANAGGTISTKLGAPFTAIKVGATGAAAATANLSSKIEDLPKGAESVNTIVSGFGRFAAQIGGIPGLLLSIPAGIAGIAMAAVTAAGKTERQLDLLTNKLAIIEAAKLNISIDKIDTTPLRKIAEETERVAKQIQTATNVQSSKLISLATNSLPKGLDTAQIGNALKAAVGLSEVYGTSVEDGMYRARQAMEGNFESFEKLIPLIKTMATDEEKLAAVSQLAANGLKVMAGESLTFWGTIEKVKNGLGNTLEALGRMRSMSDLVGTVLRDVVTPAVTFLDSKLKGFGFNGDAVLKQMTSIGAGVIATVELIRDNWITILDRMTTASELFWVQMLSGADNFLKNGMPWFTETMESMFDHMFGRLGQKWKDHTALVMSASAETFGLSPKGSTDMLRQMQLERDNRGFQAKPMPGLPERAKSDRENALQSKLDSLDSKLGDSFKIKFDKAFSSLDGILKDQAMAFDVNLNKAPQAPEPTPAIDAATKTANRGLENFTATQSRLLTRGPAQDAAKFTAQNTAQSVVLLRQMLVQQQRAQAELDRKKGRITNLVVVK